MATDYVQMINDAAAQKDPGSTKQIIGVSSNAKGDKAILEKPSNVYSFNSDLEYAAFEDPTDAVKTLPNSLFYEAHSYEDGRTGLFNYYVIGDAKSGASDSKSGTTNKFTYFESELRENNQKVTPDVSRNPTAKAIIDATTTNGNYLDPGDKYIGQPYNVKDFIFCKYYGIIPNNRMVTLRRFPSPVMDNLKVPFQLQVPTVTDDGSGQSKFIMQGYNGISKEMTGRLGVGLPIAQAVTFFGEGTGNDLNSILGISTGLKWNQNEQQAKRDEKGNDPGIMNTPISKLFEAVAGKQTTKIADGVSNVLGTLTDPDNVMQRIKRSIFDTLTTGDGPLSKKIWVDVNTVDRMYTRARGFEGGEQSFNLTFTYSLTSVGAINSRMLFIDLLANLLAIGSDYGKFLTPQLLYASQKQGLGFPGGPNAYMKFLLKPVDFINDMLAQSLSAEMTAKKKTITDDIKKSREELSNLNKGIPLPKDGVVYKTLSALLTTQFISKIQYEPLMLSGYPTGEWHVVVGNPLNPIAMMGNLICSNVAIKLNDVLGPDDFPTEMTATYSMKAARQKHRGDFESMLNRGNGRLYLGKMPTASQSKNAWQGVNTGGDPLNLPNDPLEALYQSSIANNTLNPQNNK
jgi:hypothetical protein